MRNNQLHGNRNYSSFTPNLIAFCFSAIMLLPSVQALFLLQSSLLYVPFLAGICLFSVVRILRPRHDTSIYSISVVFVLGIFVFWMLLSSSWGGNPIQQLEDSLLLLTLLIFSICTALLVDSNILDRVLKYFLYAGGVISLFAFFVQMSTSNEIFNLLYKAYLTYSHIQGLATIISVGFAMTSSGKNRMIWAIFSMVNFAGLSVSFGRGPLLFSIFLTGLMVVSYRAKFFSINKLELYKVKKVFIVSLFVVAPVMLAFTVEHTRERILRLVFDFERELVQGGRGELWQNSFDAIEQKILFGHGLSSSGEISAGDPSNYPHNFLLQVLVDGGVVAGALILFVVILAVVKSLVWLLAYGWDRRSDIAIFCFYFELLNYMKSGNFYTSRTLLFFLVLVASSVIVKNIPLPRLKIQTFKKCV